MSANPYKTESIPIKEDKTNGPYFIVKITKPTYSRELVDAIKCMKKSLDEGNPFIPVPENITVTYIPENSMEVVKVE